MAATFSPGVESAVESVELEAFASKIPNLVYSGTTTYSLFKSKAKTEKISNITAAGGTTRSSFRVPFRVQAGAPVAQGTGDNDSLGLGSMSQWGAFAVSPVFIYSVTQISWLAQQSTEGRSRGLFEVKVEEMKNSLDTAMQGLEALFNSDGTGALDQIPSTATVGSGTGSAGPSFSSIVGLNCAAAFTDQQNVTVYPSETSSSPRGVFTISYVDPVTNTIYSSAALPSTGGATATGDYLFIYDANTASGAAAASIQGIRAWCVNSATGTIGGQTRATYPTRLSTPQITLNAAPTAGLGSRTAVVLGRALGPNNSALKSMIWHTDPTVGYALANDFYSTQVPNSQAYKGEDAPPDLSKKMFQKSFAGYPVHISWNAFPGRMDGLVLDNWYIGELAPLGLYDFGGGSTVAPVPDIGGTNASYKTSHMFVYDTALNLINAAPRQGIIVSNVSVPTI